MDNYKNVHHLARHIGISYPVSLWQRLHAVFTPLALVAVFFIILQTFSVFSSSSANVISPGYAGAALLATFAREVLRIRREFFKN